MDINRKTAFTTLLQIEKKGAYSNLALNENIERSKADSPSFVRELTYGVLKNKYLLDYYLKAFVKKGYGKLKPEVLCLLRMGAYQLIFMDSVPTYAAVSETVDLARKFARGREGFINGVLRSLSRSLDELPEVPRDDFREYLGTKYSCEAWISDLLIKAFGEEGAEEYLNASNETPELYIRVNLLKNSPEELMEELRGLGF
ncbi:MAG: 16S rRNA (cytosine(967)-C(5))-methyltransferase RsmB, partial [Firmicutes bacterium]|nr:16S rRNA (cytosine(967)-C(5))-methyltransferase RsmB [Bacillota bacterium]